MKNLLAGLAIFGTFAFVSAQTITFDQMTIDYGAIKPGSDGTRFFTLKNTGDRALILSNVAPSCGCTTPEWNRDPILPGKSANIKVGYNTMLNGPFNKMIEIFSNDPVNSRSVIYIKGNVDINAPDPKPLTRKELRIKAKAERKAAKLVKKLQKQGK